MIRNVLGPESHAHEPRGNAAQKREAIEQSERQRQLSDLTLSGKKRPNRPILYKDLHCLRGTRGKFAALLYFGKLTDREAALEQRRCESIGCGNGILDSEIYSHSTDGRHGVRCVADTKQAGTEPLGEPVDSYGEKLYLVPIAQRIDTVAHDGRKCGEFVAKTLQALLLNLVKSSFANHKSALPIILAIEHDEDFAGISSPE